MQDDLFTQMKDPLLVGKCRTKLKKKMTNSAWLQWIHAFSFAPPHISLNREGRWVTTDDFTTSFLHFSLFSTALWDSANSRPVHSLMLSSHLIFCLPCFLPPFTVPCKRVLARPDEREIYPYHCSLRLFTIVRGS